MDLSLFCGWTGHSGCLTQWGCPGGCLTVVGMSGWMSHCYGGGRVDVSLLWGVCEETLRGETHKVREPVNSQKVRDPVVQKTRPTSDRHSRWVGVNVLLSV